MKFLIILRKVRPRTALLGSGPSRWSCCTGSARRPVFCVRTAKHLLGEGTAGSADFHRKDELEAGLRDAGLGGVAELEFDLLPVVAAMEKAGVGVDVTAWAELVHGAEREMAGHAAELQRLGLSRPDDDAHVRGAFVARGIDTNSTSWKALAAYKDDPLVAALVGYRRTAAFLQSTGRPGALYSTPPVGAGSRPSRTSAVVLTTDVLRPLLQRRRRLGGYPLPPRPADVLNA